MRARRVRFTRSSVRSTDVRQHAVKTREGVSTFRQSPAGRALRDEKIREQWSTQGGKCHICEDRVDLAQAVLMNKTFKADEINPVVHRRCRKGSHEAQPHQ